MRRTIAIILSTLIAVLVVAMPTFAQTLAAPVYLPLIIAAAAATPMPTTLPTPVPDPCPGIDRAMELEVLRLINVERAKAGLKALVEDARLTVAARCHAADMAAHDLLSHTGSDGSTPPQRVLTAGYVGSCWGEIAVLGRIDAQAAFDAWLGSSAHKAIMLSVDATEFGAGYGYNANGTWKEGWVVDFGRR